MLNLTCCVVNVAFSFVTLFDLNRLSNHMYRGRDLSEGSEKTSRLMAVSLFTDYNLLKLHRQIL